MSFEFDYSSDTEFNKLLAWRTDIDLIAAAQELARDVYPQLDFGFVSGWIHARAQELKQVIHRATSDREVLELVAKQITDEHEVIGADEAYNEPDGSFLHRVIETGHGIPISLTLLHIGVCRELGIDLQGVCSPRHFLGRLDTAEGPLFLDAFHGSRVMTQGETTAWLSDITNLPQREIARHLKPVGARPIIARMLNNLKVIYAERLDWNRLWVIQSRITALAPGEYAERRDLALAAVQADRAGLAIRLLKSLLSSCPPSDRSMLELHLKDAESKVHHWN